MAPNPDKRGAADDDNISVISSSVSGESEAGEVFDVETILAQRGIIGRMEYLVKWDGYDILNATWEPEDSFNSDDTLMDWARKNLEIRSGSQPRFDVKKWERDYQKVYAQFSAAGKDMAQHNSELQTNLEDYFFPLPAQPAQPAQPASSASTTEPARPASAASTDSLFMSSTAGPHTSTPPGGPDMGPAVLPSHASQPQAPESSRPAGLDPEASVPGKTLQQQRPLAPKPSRPEVTQQQAARNQVAQSPRRYEQATKAIHTASKFSKPASVFRGFGQRACPRQKPGSRQSRADEQAPNIPLDLRKPSDYANRENYGYVTPTVRVNHTSGVTNEITERLLATQASGSGQTSMEPPALPQSTIRPFPSKPLVTERRDRPREEIRSPRLPNSRKGSWSTDRKSKQRPTEHSRRRSPDIYSRRPNSVVGDDSYRPNYSSRDDSFRPSRSQELSNPSKSTHPLSPLSAKPPFSGPPARTASRDTTQEPSQPISSGATLSEKQKIALMRVGSPGANAVKVAGDLFWNPGEVLVHVYFGTLRTYIGPLRIVGSEHFNKRNLLNSVKASKGPLELWFQHLYTIEEFPWFSLQFFKGNAFLEGLKGPRFDETNTALFRTGEYLLYNKIAATCKPAEGLSTWIAYSPFSEFDDRLTHGFQLPNDIPIALAVVDDFVRFRPSSDDPRPATNDFLSTPEPPINHPDVSDNVVRDLSQSVAHGQIAPSRVTTYSLDQGSQKEHSLVNSPTVHPSRQPLVPRLHAANSPARSTGHELNHQMSTPEAPRGASIQSNGITSINLDNSLASQNDTYMTDGDEEGLATMDTTPDVHEPFQSQGILLENIGKAIDDFISNTASITIEELANGTAQNFYLHFLSEDQDAQQDLIFMEKWLDYKKVNYTTSRDPANWERFSTDYYKKGGVVLFHESFWHYQKLRPKIKQLQRAPNINFWVIRVSRPLDRPDTRFVGENENRHIQSLFPNGSAILLTEDIFQDMKQAALITYWFTSKKAEREPGTNKLVLMPGVLSYLRNKLEDPEENEENKGFAFCILIGIQYINSRDPNAPYFDPNTLENIDTYWHPSNDIASLDIPEYGSRPEDDHPDALKGLTQDERNADQLVEAFAWWLLTNSFAFRKTIVISNQTNQALRALWSRWGHVNVYDVDGFLQDYRIDEAHFLAKLREPLSDSNSPRRDQDAVTSMYSPTPVTPRGLQRPRNSKDSRPSHGDHGDRRESRNSFPHNMNEEPRNWRAPENHQHHSHPCN
ncbi:hypothetical protein N7478_010455 [Penicillium angulare]|uniref:uncharacterized protein n=1 Tax=Penicillium angulare TaxID=116970 RepID=UPI00253FA36B|nr:uncharacterized protein N7478_010455 [Penicillium angulare]KAJ5267647.1 hypothetical protein N7478_010455 [Penicillium angulare]